MEFKQDDGGAFQRDYGAGFIRFYIKNVGRSKQIGILIGLDFQTPRQKTKKSDEGRCIEKDLEICPKKEQTGGITDEISYTGHLHGFVQ